MGELVTIDAGHDPGRARLLLSVLDADDVVARLVEPSGTGPYPGLESYRLLIRAADEQRARALVDTVRPAPRRPRRLVRWGAAAMASAMLAGTLSGVIAVLL